MKVSVIIPVYNGERYLRECLDSVVAQTYDNYEIIIIDDGSKDASGIIAEEYASEYNNIQVLHKDNKGLICARIDGVSMAKGEYIAFVDADDWVDEDFLEMLVQHMEQSGADIVTSGCIREKAGVSTVVYDTVEEGVYSEKKLEEEIYLKMLCYKSFFEFGILPYMWNKLYKREMLKCCYKDINTAIYDGEDAAVVFPYLLQAKKIKVVADAKYHYRIHSLAMTAKKKEDYYENVSNLYLYLNKQFKETKFYAMLLPQLDQYMRMMIRNGNIDAFIEAEPNMFPFDKVSRGAKIILYGAGHVGKLYYHQVRQVNYCDVVAWVDKGKAGDIIGEYKINTLEEINEMLFDCIVVAVAGEEIKIDITDALIMQGIDRKKIIA